MKRYTLDEAEKIRAMQYCARHDHSWNIISSLGKGPRQIICSECGWFGDVSMGDYPKRPAGIDEGATV